MLGQVAILWLKHCGQGLRNYVWLNLGYTPLSCPTGQDVLPEGGREGFQAAENLGWTVYISVVTNNRARFL